MKSTIFLFDFFSGHHASIIPAPVVNGTYWKNSTKHSSKPLKGFDINILVWTAYYNSTDFQPLSGIPFNLNLDDLVEESLLN